MPNLPVSDVLKLEGIPNRDSVSYEELYCNGNRRELSTLFRGTLRWGYSLCGTVMNIEDFRIRFSKVSRVQRPSVRFQVDWSSGHEETHHHLRVVQTGARYP